MHVLVTGANGHVGNNLCRALAERGHRVRASVRSLEDPAKSAPLRGLPHVELIELDMRDAVGFDAAVAGVEVLFHVAATYALYTGSRQRDEEMVRDGLEGVENALRSAARRHVRKVVLTSSIATLPMRRPGEPVTTEDTWRTDLRVPYHRAKTLRGAACLGAGRGARRRAGVRAAGRHRRTRVFPPYALHRRHRKHPDRRHAPGGTQLQPPLRRHSGRRRGSHLGRGEGRDRALHPVQRPRAPVDGTGGDPARHRPRNRLRPAADPRCPASRLPHAGGAERQAAR